MRSNKMDDAMPFVVDTHASADIVVGGLVGWYN